MRAVLSIVIGAVLFSAAMNLYLLPAEIVLGGMTGIATVLKLLWGVPTGVTILLLNLPLMLLHARRSGRGHAGGAVLRTLIGVTATSLASDLPIAPAAVPMPLAASLIGGTLVGISAGMYLARGYTTGGTDLAAILLREVFPGLTLGRAIMLCDLAIIVGAAVILGRFGGIVYSAVCSVSAGIATDAVLRASRRGG